MISIMFELSTNKIKGHIKRNWPLYAIGAGAVGSGLASGEVAERLGKAGKNVASKIIRGARTPALIGTGIALAKTSERLKKEYKNKKINEDTTTKQTADVIEKTGGQRTVAHLRKHWKKYATLAGAGLATSLAGEGMRLSAGKQIRDIANQKDINKESLSKASQRLTKGEVIDTVGSTATVGGGALAATGKLYDRRKGKRT